MGGTVRRLYSAGIFCMTNHLLLQYKSDDSDDSIEETES